MAAPLHPAVTVTNIKNYIPILLETEDSRYTSWVELFKIHCRAFQVLDHILPPVPSPATKEKDLKADEQWSRIDAIVLQWMYGTISKDLLVTILSPGTTAIAAWKAIENIFIDSKPARALHLQHKFANVKLQNFPNMAAYCQEVKNLSDQLTNVEAPVDNQRLVLQLISGLSDQFDSITTLLQQSTPLPDFYTARSKLCLEETRKSLHNPPDTTLTASVTTPEAHVTGTTTTDQWDSGPAGQRTSGTADHRLSHNNSGLQAGVNRINLIEGGVAAEGVEDGDAGVGAVFPTPHIPNGTLGTNHRGLLHPSLIPLHHSSDTRRHAHLPPAFSDRLQHKPMPRRLHTLPLTSSKPCIP
ncbi:hypothetical protein L1887_34556 [Cichorium endivia]|nr:hypothetical protein L1887_34556 [Cichorium endivia]